MKVLIVDDSMMVRNAVERVLATRVHYSSFHATNGVEAVEMFARERPDFVTMDITMPEMDGIECVTKLLQIDPDAKILVISSLEDAVTGIEIVKRGAKGFLCKPFATSELLSAIDDVIHFQEFGEQ